MSEARCGLWGRYNLWWVALCLLGIAVTPNAFAEPHDLSAAPLVIADDGSVTVTLPAGRWLLGKADRFCNTTLTIDGIGDSAVMLPASDEELLLYPIKSDQPLSITLTPEVVDRRALKGEVHLNVIDAAGLPDSLLKAESELLLTFDAETDRNVRERAVRSLALAEQWQALGELDSASVARWLMAAALYYRLDQYQQSENAALQAVNDTNQIAGAWEQGHAKNTLGLNMAERGETDGAERNLQEAAARLADFYKNRAVSPADSNLCFRLFRRRALQEAETCYRGVLETAQQVGDAEETIQALNNLGGTFSLRGKPRAALEYLNRAVTHPSLQSGSLLRARLCRTNALELGRLGRFQESFVLLNESLEILEMLDNQPEIARTLNNMAIIYGRMGAYRQAADLAQRAFDISRGINSRAQLRTGLTLARALNSLEETDQATSVLDELDRLSEDSADTQLKMRLRLLQATTVQQSGDATHAFQMIEPLIESYLADKRFDNLRTTTFISAARMQLIRRDAPSAIEFADYAVSNSKRSENSLRYAESLTVRAEAKQLENDVSGALVDALAAIDIVEAMRGDIQNIELRASYQATVQTAYAMVIDIEASQGEIAAALEAAERYRAQTLIDVLEKGNAAPPVDAPQDLLDERADLRAEINRREQARLNGRGNESIADLLTRLDVLDGEITKFDPRFGATQRDISLSTAELQATLDPGTLVLQYFLGEQRSYVWLISRDALKIAELPSKASLRDLALELHATLKRRGRSEASRLTAGRVLLSPFAEQLRTSARVSIVADGPLHYLPFDALLVSESEPPLLLGKAVSYQPSLTALALSRAKSRKPDGAVFTLADPVFGNSDQRLAQTSVGSGANGDSLNRLRLSAREAAVLAKLTPERVTAYSGFSASTTALQSEDFESASIVHLATHGFADDETPARTGVMFSLFDESGKPQPGFVGLRDIYELRMNAELVTLSACDTALGRELAGEGLLGLTQGFMYAGARRVVASLWPASDRATAELMEHFYTGLLRDGLAPDAALAAAKVKLRQKRRFRDPYYWSAFTLHGDWRPLD
ncbi:MAG: CHAT domain-containing tetratricopeptide repeat protein [Pseudomonadota bacterium]